MEMQKWIDELLISKVKKVLPILSFPGVQLIDKSVNELIRSSDLQARCMKAIADRYPSAASVSLMDLSVEAECFGSNIRFSDNEVPTVLGSIFTSTDEIENLSVPEIGSGRTQICIDAVKQAKKLIFDRPVFAGVIGPFSLSGRLLDMTEIMVSCMDEPELTHKLLEKSTKFITKYAQAFKEAGADGIVLAEPAAGLLSPAFNSEFSVPYIKNIIDKLQDDSFIVVYHNCGPYTIRQIDDILTVGAKIYHFGDAIDLSEMKDHIPENILFSGNVSPSECFNNGTAEYTEKKTKELLSSCGSYLNFIPSSGCDIPPASKFENIDIFFETVSKYYGS